MDRPISGAEFRFRIRGDDGKARSSRPFDVVEYLIHRAAQTLFRLSEASAYAFNRVHTIRHLLVGAGVHNDHFGFALHSQDERAPGFTHPFHETNGIAFEGRHRLNILADVDHGEESSKRHSRTIGDAI
jgi:hypothetical protein